MDTEQGNKLIAEFMGGKIEVIDNAIYLNKPFSIIRGLPQGVLEPSYLEYHISWDWLMPVVEKISDTVIKGHPPFNSDQIVRVEIVPFGYVKIHNLRDTPIIKNVSIAGSLITATWVVVTAFIEWLNKEQKAQVSDTTMLPNEQKAD